MILEERYGNDGYAFWFKLLEVLGDTEGHYFRVGNPAQLAFLGSLSHIDPVSVTEILDMLADIEAIDPELWTEKVVWVQHFVDGLAPVYGKRAEEITHRPHFRAGNNGSSVNPVPETHKGKDRIGEKEKNTKKEIESGTEPEASGSDRHPDSVSENSDGSHNCKIGHEFRGSFCRQCIKDARAVREVDEY